MFISKMMNKTCSILIPDNYQMKISNFKRGIINKKEF